jgi:hypothetical protein
MLCIRRGLHFEGNLKRRKANVLSRIYERSKIHKELDTSTHRSFWSKEKELVAKYWRQGAGVDATMKLSRQAQHSEFARSLVKRVKRVNDARSKNFGRNP